MKFHFVIEGDYEVREDDLFRAYGTEDPFECAAIDTEQLESDPAGFLELSTVTWAYVCPVGLDKPTEA